MKNLVDFARQLLTPTDDQHEALVLLDAFLNSTDRCFLLKGYAGTGKTFLTRVIAGYLEALNKPVVLMAPTGRAARVLSDKTGYAASTIHKGIYNLDELDEIRLWQNDKVKYKFRYNIGRNETSKGGVFIIDEASMISDRLSENDFFVFGSGKLLSDLVDFTALKHPDSTTKIIFVGDPAQLPPVGDPVSGALSEMYLEENFGIHATVYELTGVVRQSGESDILKLATNLRSMLTASVRNSFRIEDQKDVVRIGVAEVTRMFLDNNPQLSWQKSVIINFSNRASLDFNLEVRKKIFPSQYQVEPGDTLMIVQNNYNYEVELFNGTMVKVTEVAPDPEIKAGMLSYNPNGDECRVSCRFRRLRIEVPGPNNRLDKLECLVLEDFLYSPDPGPSYSQNVALYLDFKMRHPHLKPKTRPFADALRKDPWFNALKVKYGYAITCHKAQGGEWEDVFLNLDTGMNIFTDAFLRWMYTAVTRSTKNLYVFNVPVKHQFSNLRYIHSLLASEKPTSGAVGSVVISDSTGFDNLAGQLGANGLPKFRSDKFFEIWAIASAGKFDITRYAKENWCDIYGFISEDKTAGLKFWFNGKNQFTSIEIFAPWTSSADFGQTLLELYKKPVNIQLVNQPSLSGKDDQKPINEITYEETDDQGDEFFRNEAFAPLKTLFKGLQPGLTEYNIRISGIVHQNYLENYYFERNEEKAMIQFWYNNQFAFSTAKPDLLRCNSNALLNDLKEIVDNIKTRNDD